VSGARVSKRTKVVYIVQTLWVGGAEEMVQNLVRHLPAERYEPIVCCIGQAGPIGSEITAMGGRVVALNRVPGLRDPLAVMALYRFLRETKPDVVHTFLLTASLYGRLAAIAARVPVVIGTEVNIYERKEPRHITTERLLAKGTDCVVTSAESVKTFYIDQIRLDPRRVEVIYNAVDWAQLATSAPRETLRAALGVPADALAATIIARLTEQKGHRYLLDALASAPGLERLMLLVVGDGPLRAELEARARVLGLVGRVRFLGSRRDLGDLLAASDLFVMPSMWEGLPLSLILAMGAELPVVATAVAGIPEVVTDGRTGLLVPPGDAAALGAALARLAGNAEERRRLGAAAREYVVPRFGVDHYVGRMQHLYDRLLTRNGHG